MAKGTKELKLRITGVKNIQKITSAMEMVATQKLKRLQGRAETARPFSEKIQEMVARLAGSVREDVSPLLQSRESVARVSNLVVSADKGLCGGYNANLVKCVLQTLASAPADVEQRISMIGSKGARLLAAKGREVDEVYPDVVEKLEFPRVRTIIREHVAAFLEGEVDQVRVIYTSFVSAAKQVPTAVTILPIDPASLIGDVDTSVDFIQEPSSDELLERLLPKFIEVKAYSAVLESLASEFAARRTAMQAATDAADDMISSLTKQYNRARQETITKELLEIVSGAEALG